MDGKKQLFTAMLLALLAACQSAEETAQEHLQKGKELFEKGDFERAILELKTSGQANDKLGETYYYMALLDEKNNNFKSMRQNLLRTVELEPNFFAARVKLGNVQLLFGDIDKALEQAEKVLAAEPENSEAQVLKASVLVKRNQDDEARKIVDEVLRKQPDNVEALSLSAVQYFDRNEFDQALFLADQGLKKDAKNLALRLFKLKIYGKKNDVDAVIESYKELIALYPNSENFKLSLASIYASLNKLQEAEILLQEMVANSPDKVEPKIIWLEFLQAKAKDRLAGEYDRLLQQTRQQAGQSLELSKWMLASGYTDEAERGLRQIVSTEQNSNIGLTAKTILAEIALNKKQYQVVENELNDILKVNSDFIEANLVRARLLLTQNKADEAIELLNKTLWTKNESDNSYLLLAQAYVQKKDAKLADKYYKQALEINPANIGAFMPVYTGYLQAGQPEIARQYLDKALTARPNQAFLLTTKAELDIQEKRWDDAEADVQRIVLFSDNKALPLYLKANILQGKGEYGKAIDLYQKLLDEFPGDLNSLLNLVASFEALKSRDKALAYLEAYRIKYPDNLAVLGVLGDLYVAAKDFTKAKQLLTSQLQRNPKSVGLYLALARLEALMSKDGAAAKAVYLQGLKNLPDEPQLLMALAERYMQTGELVQAQKTYEQLLAKQPDNDLALNNLAALLVDFGNEEDLKKGLMLAEKFKDADNPYLADTYAWALVKSGQTQEGLKRLEALIVKAPKLAEIRYHLGVAHFNSGNKATAIVELKHALDLAEKQQRHFSGQEVAKQLLQKIESSERS